MGLDKRVERVYKSLRALDVEIESERERERERESESERAGAMPALCGRRLKSTPT